MDRYVPWCFKLCTTYKCTYVRVLFKATAGSRKRLQMSTLYVFSSYIWCFTSSIDIFRLVAMQSAGAHRWWPVRCPTRQSNRCHRCQNGWSVAVAIIWLKFGSAPEIIFCNLPEKMDNFWFQRKFRRPMGRREALGWSQGLDKGRCLGTIGWAAWKHDRLVFPGLKFKNFVVFTWNMWFSMKTLFCNFEQIRQTMKFMLIICLSLNATYINTLLNI